MIFDNIILPNMHCEDRFAENGITSITEDSLDGTPITWEGATKRRKLTFVGTESRCKITYEIYSFLLERTKIIGGKFKLIWEEGETMVRFRHYEKPAVTATPLYQKHTFNNNDFFHSLIIKLEEV